MSIIKDNGGIIGAPNNACQQVKDISDYISANVGGDGAVRDFIEFLVKELI